MKKIVITQGLIETIAGICLILRPDLLFWNNNLDSISYNISKMYGIIAFCFGLLCIISYLHVNNIRATKLSALTCIGLNFFLSFHLWGLVQAKIAETLEASIFHLVVGIMMLSFYLYKS